MSLILFRLFLILLLQSWVVSDCLAQHKEAPERLMQLGNLALRQNQFKSADSLYTLALKLRQADGILVNRGIARMMLGDTCRACMDFRNSSVKFGSAIVSMDDDVRSIYANSCIDFSDTLYYDNKRRPVEMRTYKYREVTFKLKCVIDTMGQIHKKNHATTFVEFGSFANQITTDIFASFIVKNSIRYYQYIYDNSLDRNDFLQQVELIKNFSSKKYNFREDITANHKRILLEVFVDTRGIIEGCNVVLHPFNGADEVRMRLQKDIREILQSFGAVKTSTVLGEKVHRISLFSVDF